MSPVRFDAPMFLLIFVVAVPLTWWLGRESLAGLGPWRHRVSLLLRFCVVLLVVAAMAEPQRVHISDRLTVIYVVDQSLSIPPERRERLLEYVRQASGDQRRRRDRAGLVAFARDTAVVTAPVEESVPVGGGSLEVALDPEATNVAAALRLAQGLFPEDAAKRIVLVTDGNENLGDALRQAQGAAAAGIGIDVVPVHSLRRPDVVVEKVVTSGEVRRGQPFRLRVALDASIAAGRGEVPGRLILTRQRNDETTVLNPTDAQQRVRLVPGKNVLTFRESIDEPAFYRYFARFIPDNPIDDSVLRNNEAGTFTHVQGRGHVLVLKNAEPSAAGELATFVARLRRQQIEVTVHTTEQLFSDLSDLQPYDAVVLANVPRSSTSGESVAGFSDEQIEMLVHNTRQFGAGLIMIGGANSFGSGGWAGTEIEKAMPVGFHLKNSKVQPVGALAMLMHASEIPQGNHWQKVIAQEAIKALGPEDYCGVLHFDGNDRWLWNHPTGMRKVGERRQQMLARVNRMTPGDMPEFDNAMQLAHTGLSGLADAAIRHMIIISDGDPIAPTASTIKKFVSAGIQVTTVAVNAHDQLGSQTLSDIAALTGGNYHKVDDERKLPKIYQSEVRRLASSLVYERPTGFTPQIAGAHEMLKGIDAPLRPITGFVLTTLKDQAELALVSPEPASERNNTILAGWVYGLGRTVALTTDAGDRWATSWTSWDGYDKLMSQIVRWAMRPTGDDRAFSVTTDARDGRGQVVVTALDENDQSIDLLAMRGMVVGPDLKAHEVPFVQTAPGRYVGEFPAGASGSYLVNIMPGQGRPMLRTGVNVGYSAEFRQREPNLGLLEKIAAGRPPGGQPGQLILDPERTGELAELVAVADTFRHDLPPATSRDPIWHLLALLAGCLFFFDVFVRRVAISLAWAGPLAMRMRDRLFRRTVLEAAPVHLERLRVRKAEVRTQIERRRATSAESPLPPPTQPESSAAQLPESLAKPRDFAPTEPEPTPEEDYAARLKKAKRRAFEDEK